MDIQVKFKGQVYADPADAMRVVAGAIQGAWKDEVGHVSQALRDYLTHVGEVVVARNSTSWPGGTSNNSLSMRSGRAMGSLMNSIKVSGKTWDSLTGTIGGSGALMIHEFGGTLRARNKKYMTIPLPAALSPKGTSPPFTYNWKNTFVARSKGGNLIIFQRRENQVIVPLYLLRTSVYIPARLGLRDELKNQIPYFMAKLADRLFMEGLQSGVPS